MRHTGHESTQAAREAMVEHAVDLRDDIIGYLRRRGIPSHQAEDMAQDVLVDVLCMVRRPATRVPVGREDCRHYLLRMAANDVVDFWRRRGRRPARISFDPALHDEAAPAPVDSPDQDVASREVHGLLEECLAELPAAARNLCVLHTGEGRSLREIARCTGRQPGAVYRSFRKARVTLRCSLARRGIRSAECA